MIGDYHPIYGTELVLDLHGCNVEKFNRKEIESFFQELCDLIEVERCDLHFWDDVGVHVKSARPIQRLVVPVRFNSF